MTRPTDLALLTVLAACRAERISAGVRSDGCGEAHIQPVINVLTALVGACPVLAPHWRQRITGERASALVTKLFCVVHDMSARGQLRGDQYDNALAEAHMQAQDFLRTVAA